MDYIKALKDYRDKLEGLSHLEKRQHIAREWQSPKKRQVLIELAFTIPIEDNGDARLS